MNSNNIVITENEAESESSRFWIKPFISHERITYLLATHSLNKKPKMQQTNEMNWMGMSMSVRISIRLLFRIPLSPVPIHDPQFTIHKPNGNEEKWWLYEYIVIIFLFLFLFLVVFDSILIRFGLAFCFGVIIVWMLCASTCRSLRGSNIEGGSNCGCSRMQIRHAKSSHDNVILQAQNICLQ